MVCRLRKSLGWFMEWVDSSSVTKRRSSVAKGAGVVCFLLGLLLFFVLLSAFVLLFTFVWLSTFVFGLLSSVFCFLLWFAFFLCGVVSLGPLALGPMCALFGG